MKKFARTNSLFIVIMALVLWSCDHSKPERVLAPLDMADFIRFRDVQLAYVQGLEGPETGDNFRWRWATGPRTYIAFLSDATRNYVLAYDFHNPIDGQEVRVTVNGRFERLYSNLPATPWGMVTIPDTIRFTAVPGLNVVEFEFSKHNRGEFMPDNPLPLAVDFRELKLYSKP